MPLDLKSEELKILSCIREDARMSVSDIAKKSGMPISTARHRLNRMFKDGLVEVGAMINPFKLGYQIWAIFEIKVELKRIEEVAHRLAEEEKLYFIGITAGRYDIWAAGVFKSNDDLFAFITERLAPIQGIQDTATASILKLVKRNTPFDFAASEEIPAPLAAEPAEVAAPPARGRPRRGDAHPGTQPGTGARRRGRARPSAR